MARTIRWMGLGPVGLLAAFLLAAAAPSPAAAQNAVVAKFRDKTGRAKLGKKAWVAVARALKRKGVRLVAYRQYLRIARKSRIKRRGAFKPRGVRRLAERMKLAAVITGTAYRKRGAFIVGVRAMGADGRVVFKKGYRLRRARFPRAKADEVAAAILEALDLGAPAAAAPEPEPEPKPEPKPEPEPGTGGTGDDSVLPAWARSDDQPEPKTSPSAPAAEPPAKEQADAGEAGRAEARAAPEPEREPRPASSVNDALVSAGVSFHHRAGLHPRHEASLYPGLRFDGRLFLGTFLDIPVVRDIGVGGMFDMALGLEYAYSDSDDAWEAQQMQWRAELTYRLALDTGLKPAFLLRLGYGSTSSSIDAGAGELALSASYMSPYASIDIYLMLYDPVLRLFASGGILYLVSAGEDVGGSGLGFNVFAGVDIDVIDAIHIGLGYDLTQYMLEDGSADGLGEYSDTFQSFFLRVGYNYN